MAKQASTVHLGKAHAPETVTDVLEEQGRRAGLFPTVISGISSQLTVRVSYNALQCDNVLVNPNAQNMQILGWCLILFLDSNTSHDPYMK
ncbi:hypothetical protein KIN20_013665 [Parelaphostrongylus tenuis]|uniref:Uncharacterized protein n=1 Tax=Parelaphostrongylus tenuis TaxID=148309 RepID=A0AAD5MUU4_PARTN|nr:hypothetical protein KIN20_013665 [Parelaphostrongylus tenuis]